MTAAVVAHDSEAFVKWFFSSEGPIPGNLQKDYAEAFRLRWKQLPEDNPKKFSTYITSTSDAVLDPLLLLWAQKRGGSGHSVEASLSSAAIGKENVMVERSSAPCCSLNTELWPLNVIFSLSQGSEPAAAEAKEFQNLYASGARFCAASSSSSSSSSSSKPRPSVTVGARSAAPLFSIERYQGLESLNDYTFLDGDADALASSLTLKCDVVCGHIAQDLDHGDSTDTVTDDTVLFGRIIADSEGGLNEHSALLEVLTQSQSVVKRPFQLLLNCLDKYAVFPGQAVGVRVAQQQGHRLYSKAIIPGIRVLPPEPLVLQRVQQRITELGRDLHILVAAGPFCGPQGFDTTILDNLVDHVEETLPDAVLLLGPFVDIKNRVVAAGDPVVRLSVKNGSSHEDGPFLSYDDLYRVILNRFAINPKIQSVYVMLIPSVNDVGHPFPLPQPPLDLRRFFPGNAVKPNVMMGTNPSTLLIADVLRLAVTSADPISPLLTSLITKGHPGSVRLKLVHSALLQQLSFFPTHPLHAPLDPYRVAHPPCTWAVNGLPHVVLYSCDRLPPGARNVEGRIFVNCAKLVSRAAPTVVSMRLQSGTHDASPAAATLNDIFSVQVLQLTAASVKSASPT